MSADAFSRALAGGAVSYIAQLVREAVHPFVIINKIRAAYRGMNMSEVADVYYAGVGAYSSAQLLMEQPAGEILPTDMLQPNPALFGRDPMGLSIRYGVLGEFTLPGETVSRFRMFNLNASTPLSLQEIQQWWQVKFESLSQGGSPRANEASPDSATVQRITILYAEHRSSGP